MKRVVRLAATGMALSFLMAGCASGVRHSEMASSIPSLKSGEGRVYFLRSASMLGAAVQPDLRLNNDVVGESKPGGFFFVDRPAGKYVAAAATETEKTLSFVLDSGETKYVRSSPSMGLMVGRVVLELKTPEKAKEDLASLSYTGDQVKTAAK
jgi:hypothetical protein